MFYFFKNAISVEMSSGFIVQSVALIGGGSFVLNRVVGVPYILGVPLVFIVALQEGFRTNSPGGWTYTPYEWYVDGIILKKDIQEEQKKKRMENQE
jgi:hypothetical protein